MVIDPVKQWVGEVAKEYKGKKVSPQLIERIFWTAFRSYINREACRHKRDVLSIRLDDGALAGKNIPHIPIPTDLWIKVPE